MVNIQDELGSLKNQDDPYYISGYVLNLGEILKDESTICLLN